MKVYHGSYTEIKTVDLSQCEPYKDFGKADISTELYLKPWTKIYELLLDELNIKPDKK